MEDARSYLDSIAPAAEALFKTLSDYGWTKMRAFVDITKVKTREELEVFNREYGAIDIAREVISGSILQLAYFGIKQFGVFTGKSTGAIHFEAEMNRLLRECSKPRMNKEFFLPQAFCVGRDIGDLPLGMIVYAGRNQYNHYDDERLTVVNEVVFNHLHQLWPQPTNGRSFNIYDNSHFYCWSVLCALGWVADEQNNGYLRFKKDLLDIMRVEA